MIDLKGTPRIDSSALDRAQGLLGKLLCALPSTVREDILSQAKVRKVAAGEVISVANRISTEVGYVLEGTLAIVQVIDDKRKHIVGLLVPTDIFGRLFDSPATFQIEALAPTLVLLLPRAQFEKVLLENREAERLFFVHLLDEMDAAREWVLLISGRKVLHRVASLLMILLRRNRSDRPSKPMILNLPLARKDLAHYLGARPESLSRAFHELADMGVLRIVNANSFEILDQDRLAETAGDDLMIDTRDRGAA